jgi:hypothetical protein
MGVPPPSLVCPAKSKSPGPPWLVQSYAHSTLQLPGAVNSGVDPIPDPLITVSTLFDGAGGGVVVVVVVVGEAVVVGGAGEGARAAAA